MVDVNGNTPKGKKRRLSVDEVRIRHLNKLARHRYSDGNGDYILPDDAEGRALAMAIVTHQRFKSAGWLFKFCCERAQWLDPNEIDRKALRPKKADALGQELRLTAELRGKLGLNSIGSCDQTRRERTMLQKAKRRERDRERQRRKRLMAGKQSRADYLASALSRTRPWEQEGTSRRTWFRKRGTTPSPCNTLSTADRPVPSRKATAPDKPQGSLPKKDIPGERPAIREEQAFPFTGTVHYLLRLYQYRQLTSGKLVEAVPGLAACSELRRVAA